LFFYDDWSSFYILSVVSCYVGEAFYDWIGVLLQFWIESGFLSNGFIDEKTLPNLFLDFF